MKSAREMFEELGYAFNEIPNGIEFINKYFISDTIHIRFNNIKKYVESYVSSDSPFTPNEPYPLSVNELQAINKIVEELNWK